MSRNGKKKSRKHPKTDIQGLLDILCHIVYYGLDGSGGQMPQLRALGSRKESDWEQLEDEVYDTSRFEYRLIDMAPLELYDGVVEHNSGDGRVTEEDAKRIVGLIRRSVKSGKDVTLYENDRKGLEEFAVQIRPKSDIVKIGCKTMTINGVLAFANQQGW